MSKIGLPGLRYQELSHLSIILRKVSKFLVLWRNQSKQFFFGEISFLKLRLQLYLQRIQNRDRKSLLRFSYSSLDCRSEIAEPLQTKYLDHCWYWSLPKYGASQTTSGQNSRLSIDPLPRQCTGHCVCHNYHVVLKKKIAFTKTEPITFEELISCATQSIWCMNNTENKVTVNWLQTARLILQKITSISIVVTMIFLLENRIDECQYMNFAQCNYIVDLRKSTQICMVRQREIKWRSRTTCSARVTTIN